MKILKYLSIPIFALLLSSCEEQENAVYDGEPLLHFNNVDQTGADGSYTVTYGVTAPVDADHNVTAQFNAAKSTAVLGTDFTITENTSVLKAGNVLGGFKINITKAGAVARKKAVFTLSSPSLTNANFNREVTVNFACPSALAGTYQYSTVNAYTPDGSTTSVPGPLTGSVILQEVGVGVYSISDSSFGAFALFPGYAATSTGIRIQDQCGTLSFAGANQYGDTFVISNVVVNGNKLTFKWTTSYGEYATTTLTKSNGNWPALN